MKKASQRKRLWIIGLSISVCLAALCVYGYKKVDARDLEQRDGIMYAKGMTKPYTGRVMALWAVSKVRREAAYKQGKLHGPDVYYFINGKRESEKNWDNGVANGKFLLWFKDGKKRAVANYKDGKPDGNWIYWYEEGTKKTESQYITGVLNGLSAKWYRSGQPQYTRAYREGKNEGIWTSWYVNGQKERMESYTNNVKNGVEQAWDRQGTLLNRTVWKLGTVVSRTNFVEDADVPFWKKKQKKEKETTEKDLSFPFKVKKNK